MRPGELNTEQQVQEIVKALDKANKAGVFSLSEAFKYAQIAAELLKLPKELKSAQDAAKWANGELEKANNAIKPTPITKN